jgi:EmrB/QacA subfamily drug resistance transporter
MTPRKPEAPQSDGAVPIRVWIGYASVLLAIVLLIADYTIVETNIPDLVRDFALSVDEIGAVLTGYLAVAAAFMIPAGKLADRWGRRLLFLGGIAIYAAGGLLTGLAWDFWSLLAGRLLQGLSLATVLPTGFALLNSTFPPQHPSRQRALGLWAMAIGVAAALGPLIGGALAVTASWRIAFLAGVPLAALAAAGVRLGLPEGARAAAKRFDMAGLSLIVLAAGTLVVVADQGNRWGIETIALLVTGAVGAMAVFAWIEVRRARLGLDVVVLFALFRARTFAVGSVAAALMSCGDLGFQLVLPFFTGVVFAYNPLNVGLVLAAYGIGIGLGGAIAEPACRRYDERTVALIAIGALPITLLALIPLFSPNSLGPNGSEWTMALVLAVYGVAWGLAYAILVNVIFRDVPEQAFAMAGGIQSSMRLLAGALSAAMLTAVFSGVSASRLDAVGDATRREQAIQMTSDGHFRKCHARCTTVGPSDAAEIGAAYSIGAAATLAAAAGLSACAFGMGLLLPRRPRRSADRQLLAGSATRQPTGSP